MRNTETRDAGQNNDTKTQYVRKTRTGTHQLRRYNTPLNCITLSSCTTKNSPYGTYQGACGRSETDGGGDERRRRRRGVGRRQEGGRGRRSRPDSTTCGKASETPPSRSRSLLWGERTVFRPSQTHREGTLCAVHPASFDSVCSCALVCDSYVMRSMEHSDSPPVSTRQQCCVIKLCARI